MAPIDQASDQSSLPQTRRAFLRQLVKAGGVALAGVSFASAFGLRPANAEDGETVEAILNIAATAEAFACTHYFRALQNTVIFNDIQIEYLREGLQAEATHLAFLQQNGAQPLTTDFYFPQGTFDDVSEFAAITATAETVFVSAYLAASNRFVTLEEPELAQVASRVAVVEGQHLALMRIFDRVLASTTIFVEPIFTTVKAAVPLLQPLLDGTAGSLGKMEKTAVPFPGSEAIKQVLAS